MSEVQRYMVSYATGVGESAMPSETGNWVKFTDHASRVRELEEAVRILASEVRSKRRRVEGSADIYVGIDGLTGEGVAEMQRRAALRRIDTFAERDTNKHPVAAEAIQKASNDAQSNH
jgi:hypothetical protein